MSIQFTDDGRDAYGAPATQAIPQIETLLGVRIVGIEGIEGIAFVDPIQFRQALYEVLQSIDKINFVVEPPNESEE